MNNHGAYYAPRHNSPKKGTSMDTKFTGIILQITSTTFFKYLLP